MEHKIENGTQNRKWLQVDYSVNSDPLQNSKMAEGTNGCFTNGCFTME